MTDTKLVQPALHPGAESTRDSDPVVRVLSISIFFVLVCALTGVLYFLLTGVINPPAPRTALETQAVLLGDAVQKNPLSGQAWSDAIKTQTTLGDYAQAQRLVDQGRKAVKGDQRIYVDIAAVDLLLVQKKYKEADKLADAVVQQDKDNREAAKKLLVSKGVQAPPDNMASELGVQSRLAKARAAAGLKDWDVAAKNITEALAFSPDSADLLSMRGDAYRNLGKKAEAKKDFEAALRLAPDYAPARVSLEKLGES